jgi:hypothetical protein
MFPALVPYGLNSFSAAATFCLVLLFVETIYIALYLEETLPLRAQKSPIQEIDPDSLVADASPAKMSTRKSPRTATAISSGHSGSSRNARAAPGADDKVGPTSSFELTVLGLTHLIYLFFFSGMEFTLTFLTFDRFGYTNMQQGKLLGFVGVLSSLIQGGYVRRVAQKVGEKSIAVQGLISCAVTLVLMGWGSFSQSTLYLAAIGFAFTSATVVTSLTSLASLQSGVLYDEADRGKVLGRFRSMGQLGRSMGPIFGCGMYWLLGPEVCYCVGAIGVLVPLVMVSTMVKQPQTKVKAA